MPLSLKSDNRAERDGGRQIDCSLFNGTSLRCLLQMVGVRAKDINLLFWSNPGSGRTENPAHPANFIALPTKLLVAHRVLAAAH